MKTFLLALSLISRVSFASTNYWPAYYGSFAVKNWECQSTFKDTGCFSSNLVRIYELNGITNIDVLDAKGRVLRTNELKEKGDAKSSYSFGGTPDAPSFTVEAHDSHGKRYFYNFFEITKQGFTHLQESELGGLKQSFRRVFFFNPKE